MADESKIDETTGLLNFANDVEEDVLASGNSLHKRKKSRLITVTKASTMILESQVQMMMSKHNLAASFFGFRQFWLFAVPQATLATIVSCLAFAATTELFDERTKILLNTVVGATSIFVVFLQTMSANFKYGTRASMHEAVFEDLRNLRDDLVLLRFKLEHQQHRKYTNTNTSNEKDEEENTDSDSEFEVIQIRLLQTLSGCKSVVPAALMEAFHGIKSNLFVNETKATSLYFKAMYDDTAEICYERMGFKVYDILATEILESFLFPLVCPDPNAIIEKTMKRLKKEMFVYSSFWVDEISVEERCC